MTQIVELGWIPVKQDYEDSPVTKSIKELHSKVIGSSDLVGQWEGVQGPGGLDGSPVKSVHLAAVWTSVEAADAAKQSPDGLEMRKLWGQVIEMSSPSGPVLPWTGYFNLGGGDFAKVAVSNVVLLTGSYLPVDADTAAFEEKWQSMMRAQASSGGVTAGFLAGVHGWSVGDVVYKGEKKKAFMVVTGWDSEESVKAAIASFRDRNFTLNPAAFRSSQRSTYLSGTRSTNETRQDHTPQRAPEMNNFRRSRADAGWFSVGLASSFPDLGSDDGNLSDLRFCNTDLKPGCKVFHAPKATGSVQQSTEVDISPDAFESAEMEGDLKDQVMVFRFKGKFHAIDHKCPHSSYPLSQGVPFDIEDFGIVLSTGVTCPKHSWSFDLTTGMSDRARYKLGVWEVQLRDAAGSGAIVKVDDGSQETPEKEVWVRRKQRIG
ncbi:rieske domain-containing protein [Colletotrichum kahawae]|uniref:Rieske domain-containing protein n=1 Tax=Colletotrichum kahawae TaxID=34407 RepID=A0AAD9YQC5_COLKA|nr:rieske domain-containing protein [Colletotrichum kahawae]